MYKRQGLLREDEVMRRLMFKDGAVDLYNLEMITMLSFRFASPEAKSFRKWIIGRVTEKKRTSSLLLVCYGKGGWYLSLIHISQFWILSHLAENFEKTDLCHLRTEQRYQNITTSFASEGWEKR